MTVSFVDDDFAVVRRQPAADGRRIMTLAFGDEVELLDDGLSTQSWTSIRIVNWLDGQVRGFIRATTALRDEPVLRLSMVDVQQGDGMVLELPSGEIVLIDGGGNKLFARHVASRFNHRVPTVDDPLDVAAIIITHGDADHFDGLNDIRRSEDFPGLAQRKRVPMRVRRLYTNGLVKGPSSMADEERLGRSVDHDGRRYAVELFDDPRHAQPGALSQPFEWFTTTLDRWEQRGPIEFHRVDASMDASQLFDFVAAAGVGVEILGPFAESVPDPHTGQDEPGLRWFPKPPKSPEVHLEHGGDGIGSPSLSHTINGHSIGLRLTYGDVRIVLTGDMNESSMALMAAQLDPSDLEGEIVKAPHHGSHEFNLDALRLTKPVVALVSSGDENEFVEYIHPRATLMAALGMSMPGDTGVVLCTELAAFFKHRRECYEREDLAEWFGHQPDRQFTGEELRLLFSGVPRPDDPPGMFHGFERTNFGIVHVRTDGSRVLVFTHSGKKGLNEAYRFRVGRDSSGDRTVEFELVTTS